MQQIATNQTFTGGIDRSVTSRIAPRESFYDLNGLRQTQAEPGCLETAPWFNATQFTTGVPIFGGNESVNAKIVGAINFKDAVTSRTVYLTDTTAREQAGTQIQIFKQETYPAAETINTCCRLVINNVTALGINVGVGGYVLIEIDTATSFKWSKNGGALSASIPITTAGVSIDGGNATVYFLTTSGFTVGHQWEWHRLDQWRTGSGVYIRPPSTVQNGQEMFFTAPDSQVYSYYNATTANVIVSAGYRPFFASYLTLFDDHLICGGYARSSSRLYTQYPETLTWACSDKTDVHNMFMTDSNEADSGLLPVSQDTAVVGTVILGVFVLNQQLYIATSQGLFYTQALGLPIVFSFQQFVNFPMNLVTNSVAAAFFPIVSARDRVYLITERGPYVFDGGSFRYLGVKLQPLFLTNNVPNTLSSLLSVYNSQQNEMSWKVGTILYTYQEHTDSFYRRDIDYALGAYCLGVQDGKTVIGSANVTKNVEDITFTGLPVRNTGVGAGYTFPKVILHALTNTPIGVEREIVGTYLSALIPVYGSDTHYSTNANISVALSWYLSDTGIPTTETTNALAVWTSNSVDGNISYPRTAFRAINLALTLTGLVTNKPPGPLRIAGLQASIPSTSNNVLR